MTATDYQSLIDAPTWQFIARSIAYFPADAGSQGIAEQRRNYDAMARAFHHGYPSGVTARDVSIGGVPCRAYPGATPTVIYLHGGGLMLGGLHSHDDVCAEICARTGLGVVSVDYRLAPEHLHPAAYDDALTVTRTLAETGSYLLMGDSAGGTLAASISHALRHDANPPKGVVLIYPDLGGNADRGSYLTHANAPMLTREDILFYAKIRNPGGNTPLSGVSAYALHDSDFTGLPPTVIFSAECDPLADDGHDYAARITAAGGHAEWHLERGLVHGYLRARHSVPRAGASFHRIITAISTLGNAP